MTESRSYAPEILFLENTAECNLRCKHCHIWRGKDPEDALSIAERAQVVREFGALSRPGAALAFSGGESLARADEVFSLCGVAREAGLKTVLTSNGTSFRNLSLDRYAKEGPDVTALSLDGPEELHDFHRGVPGVFREVIAVARALVSRGRHVVFHSILSGETWRHAEAHLTLATEIGVKEVIFQPLNPTFALQGERDVHFEKTFPANEAEEIQAELLRLRERYPVLRASQAEIRAMGDYFRNPHQSTRPVCASAWRNVVVGVTGEVQLCFSMKQVVTGGRGLGNVRDRSLAAILLSAEAKEVRDRMGLCRAGCGLLTCNRM